MPARVTIGMALLSDGTEHGAFGHAWAEILEGGTWVVADAALWGTEATVRYVPIGLFENEGMGYALELMRLSQMWIDRVIVLGPGPIGILCAAMARLCGAEVASVGLENDRARLEVEGLTLLGGRTEGAILNQISFKAPAGCVSSPRSTGNGRRSMPPC